VTSTLGRRCLAITNAQPGGSTRWSRRPSAFGKIDFLINNAGGQFPPPFGISDNGWRSVMI
jgi:NAD(P)-dependent dehydrogenase (short-subunit alcohol dehydrogenase family)